MTEPKWVTRQLVAFIHNAVIKIAGGAHGLRDAALLDSALARPQSQHAHRETDTFRLAASYAEAISRNHAFVDENNLTALPVTLFTAWLVSSSKVFYLQPPSAHRQRGASIRF